MKGFLISSWQFTDESPSEVLGKQKTIQAGHWYHCQRDASDLKEWLRDNQVPAAICDSLLTDDSRPRFEHFADDCFLIIVRGINLNKGSEPDDMLSLRMLWFKGALISTRKVPSKAVSAINDKLRQGNGPKNLEQLLLSIMQGVNQIINDFLEPTEALLESLDIDSTSTQEVSDLNNRLLRLRRYLKPQKYVFEDMLNAELAQLKSQHIAIKNCHDTIMRINESVDFYLEQVNAYLLSLGQQQAEKMNRNTYLFSVLAGVFLPAGFFTGLLGVNIGGIPGTESPWAFSVFCAALIAVVVAEFAILRKLKFI